MNKEQAFFLSLIKSAVTKEKITISDDINLKTVMRYAHEQKLEVLTYFMLKNNGVNDTDLLKMGSNVFTRLVNNETFNRDINDFTTALLNGGIDCVTLKGYNERNLYSLPDMREMNDFDCLIDKKNLKTAEKLLKNAGFIFYKRTAKHVEFHSKNGYLFELHTDLYDRFLPKEFVESVLKSGSGLYAPTPEQEYIICLAHLASHYVSGGVGLRNIIDFYLLDKTEFDREFVATKLAEFKLDKFSEKILYLTKIIFETQPFNDYYDNLLSQSFSSYALGSLRKKALYELALSYNGDFERAKKKNFRKKLFPSYGVMKGNYPSLEKVPFLLPFYYFIRHVKLFFGLFKKKDKKNSFSEKEVKDACALLESLGLAERK